MSEKFAIAMQNAAQEDIAKLRQRIKELEKENAKLKLADIPFPALMAMKQDAARWQKHGPNLIKALKGMINYYDEPRRCCIEAAEAIDAAMRESEK